MRIARWIGVGALAAGLALGWSKHFVRGQNNAPVIPSPPTAQAPQTPTRAYVEVDEPPPPTAPRGKSPSTPASSTPAPSTPGTLPGTPPSPPNLPPAKTPELPAGPASSDIKIAPPGAPKIEEQPRPMLAAPPVVAGETRTKQEPSVSIEWVAPPTIRVKHPLPCQILVKNTGPVSVQDVVVKHKLNPGVVCRHSEPPAFNDNGELVWTVGALQPGQLRRLDVQLVAASRGDISCHATATFTAATSHKVQVCEPQLSVKMRAPDKVLAGDTVNVLITVSNPGDGAADLVRIKATLPEGLECVRGRVVEMDLGTLAPKGQRTVQIACLARLAGVGKCAVSATADGNLTAGDHVATEVLEPKLDIAVSGPKLRYLDRHAVYKLKVTNPGTAPLQAVTVNQGVPAGFKFHNATGGGRFEESIRTVSWQIGDLPPGQHKEVTIDLIATSLGDHRLVAQASSTRGVKSEAVAQTRVEGSSSLIIELVDVDDPVEVGSETAYEIRVSNAGTKTETNLILTCTLPEQVELKNTRCTAGAKHKLQGREVTFEPLPRLAPKADAIYRVTVRGIAPGDARMRLRIRTDGMPDPLLREESTRFYNDAVLPR